MRVRKMIIAGGAALAVLSGGLLAVFAGAAPASAQTTTQCTLGTDGVLFPTVYGESAVLDLAVTVDPSVKPTGTATFYDGTTVLQAVPVAPPNDGEPGFALAVVVADALTGGSHQITVTYSGDANNSGCSASATQVVDKASTTAGVTSSQNPSASGQPVTFTATVSVSGPWGGTPSGTVTFFDGSSQIGTGTVSTAGTASLTTSALASGSHQVTASYGGDGNFNGSTSAVLPQTVLSPPDTDLAITPPADVTVDAAGPSGAAVSYPAATVSDPDDATPPAAACTPASGTTFAIGTTTVTCTATDADDTPSMVSASFTITVPGAAAQLASLGQAVKGVGPGTSLTDKIAAAQSYLSSGDTADACGTLTRFVQQVHAQSGKSIPAGQAAQLTADATRIKAVLAC